MKNDKILWTLDSLPRAEDMPPAPPPTNRPGKRQLSDSFFARAIRGDL